MSTPEEIKLASHNLRGDLPSEVHNASPDFSHDSQVLLKFHGIYQQDDRDVRRTLTAKREPLAYSCMVRSAVPGGVITLQQWLALDRLSELADGTIRLTTRQGVQFHVVVKDELHTLVHEINAILMSTLAACGDVVRNVMACPFPDDRQAVLQPVLNSLFSRFRPRTTSYWEVWVAGEKAVSAEPSAVPPTVDRSAASNGPFASGSAIEPIYGDTYLPRKFKIGIAWPGDNSIDIYSQDVGIVPTLADGATGELTGFMIFAGGGMGMSHAREEDTYPRLATEVGWATPDQLGDVVEAIVTTQRDFGRRDDRHKARLKYTIDDHSSDWLRDQIEQRCGVRVLPSPGIEPWTPSEYHGWSPSGKTFTYGLPVPSGRVADTATIAWRSAFRELAESGLIETFIVTARQDMLLSGVKKTDRSKVEAVLRSHGVPLADDVTPLKRLAIACPALPTCGQALGEAERVLPQLVDALDKAMADVGAANTGVRLNMTGCPNGCARPYNAEIGINGRTKTNYDIYVGGSAGFGRMAQRLRADVALADIPALMSPVFAEYAKRSEDGEGFGDFCNRIGTEQLVTLLPAPVVKRRRLAAAAAADVAEPGEPADIGADE